MLLLKKVQYPDGQHMPSPEPKADMTPLSRFRMGCGPLRASGFIFVVCCAGFLALASCGGGGGGSGGNPGGGGGNNPGGGGGNNPGGGGGGNLGPTAADFEADPEYHGLRDASGDAENWALDATGAAAAYARIAPEGSSAADLAPGEGVTIAVIDSGIDLDHWEFVGADVTEEIPTAFGGNGDGPASGSTPYESSHGTAVASIILAQRGSSGGPLIDRNRMGTKDSLDHNFHGIAWRAKMRFFSARLGVGILAPVGDIRAASPYDPLPVTTLPPAPGLPPPPSLKSEQARTDSWIDTVLTNDPTARPDIISISFGGQGLAENYDLAEIRRELVGEIAARAQAGRADKTLIVAAAGNDHGHQCTPGSANCIPCSDTVRRPPRCVMAGVVQLGSKLDATSPAVDAALQVFFDELKSHVVAVVATDRDGNIATFSNRCGIAAKWCIAAPGVDILVARFNPGMLLGSLGDRSYLKIDGTSFSAPYVAGGLAVLMHYVESTGSSMGNVEILMRLYSTADQSGAAAPDSVAAGEQCPDHLNMEGTTTGECELSSIFGWGRMDLDAATMPLGVTTIALGDTLYDLRVPAASSGFRGGAAFGNALTAGLRGRTITVFDEFDFPFRVDLDRFVAPAAMPAMGYRLVRFLEPETEFYETGGGVRVAVKPGTAGGLVDMPLASARLRFGINHSSWEGPDSAWATGHASLIPLSDGGASLTFGNSALQFSAFATSPKFADAGQGPPQTAGAMLSWNPANGPLGFRVGALHEFGSSLGMEATGAFGDFASDLAFAGVGLRAEAGGWEWSAAAELGRSTPKASPGSVQEVSGLASSAFSVSGERSFKGGGQLHLSAAWPLRVERGRLQLKVATSRDKQRNVQHETVDTSLVPSGRQLDLGAKWRQPVGVEGGELRLGAALSLEPGHEAGRSPELALMAGYHFSF